MPEYTSSLHLQGDLTQQKSLLDCKASGIDLFALFSINPQDYFRGFSSNGQERKRLKGDLTKARKNLHRHLHTDQLSYYPEALRQQLEDTARYLATQVNHAHDLLNGRFQADSDIDIVSYVNAMKRLSNDPPQIKRNVDRYVRIREMLRELEGHYDGKIEKGNKDVKILKEEKRDLEKKVDKYARQQKGATRKLEAIQSEKDQLINDHKQKLKAAAEILANNGRQHEREKATLEEQLKCARRELQEQNYIYGAISAEVESLRGHIAIIELEKDEASKEAQIAQLETSILKRDLLKVYQFTLTRADSSNLHGLAHSLEHKRLKAQFYELAFKEDPTDAYSGYRAARNFQQAAENESDSRTLLKKALEIYLEIEKRQPRSTARIEEVQKDLNSLEVTTVSLQN